MNYNTRRLTARVPMPYMGAYLAVGDHFDATPTDAEYLVRSKFASVAPAAPTETPAPTAPPPSGTLAPTAPPTAPAPAPTAVPTPAPTRAPAPAPVRATRQPAARAVSRSNTGSK